MHTYIIGHTKPDTDAVVSAIALSELYQHVESFGRKGAIPVISDPLNPETEYLFNKWGLTPPKQLDPSEIYPDDSVVLVDHNEASQRMEGIAPEQIVEVIDHHKVNLNLTQPIFLTFKPWGSTSTIIYHLMQQNNYTPSEETASLMLAAVLSDTVGYKSATTTDKDKQVGEELAKIAGIEDVDAFTLEIFKAKSNLSSLSPLEITKNDYKIFDFNQTTFINQIETVEQDVILNQRAELLEAMQQVKEQEKVELVFIAVTDILQVNTRLLCLSENEAKIATQAFDTEVNEHIADIGPKMSRKKEIAPAIEAAVNRGEE